jgi:YesN/AraC family two-component response regulator
LTASLRAQWISCTSNSSPAELLEQCRRLCQAGICDARHALTAIVTAKPDIIVFEFDNPIAEHLQLLQSVKRLHPSIPILMITSTHSEELAIWAFRTRVWNYLVKPVPLRELKSNIDQLAKISRHRTDAGRQIERPGTMMPLASGVQSQAHAQKSVTQRIIENIRRDHTTRLSVAQLARDCGMSRFSFSRFFRSNFGCSCREYVMRLRIETACKMLEEPHPSVTHVAIAAGFTDASYFARIFRRHMRKTPIEYAQMASSRSPQDTVVGLLKRA